MCDESKKALFRGRWTVEEFQACSQACERVGHSGPSEQIQKVLKRDDDDSVAEKLNGNMKIVISRKQSQLLQFQQCSLKESST